MQYAIRILSAAALACALLATSSTFANDSVTLIDQARAMAGGVVPGDEPGWPVRMRQSGHYRLPDWTFDIDEKFSRFDFE
ncbi:hypothetical protein [Aquabacterium sp.]|uniref:hypothetical protein n=1 Tax=Aquabacterium sp. TaxID=1872578 RepID=UPI002CB11AF0|nr:hypothetical protein [Aquabacterium sp.]HSW05087.1 hypothetical protein [Aquabacterium sp.]